MCMRHQMGWSWGRGGLRWRWDRGGAASDCRIKKSGETDESSFCCRPLMTQKAPKEKIKHTKKKAHQHGTINTQNTHETHTSLNSHQTSRSSAASRRWALGAPLPLALASPSCSYYCYCCRGCISEAKHSSSTERLNHCDAQTAQYPTICVYRSII